MPICVPLYVGSKKKKDIICLRELSKFIDGNRSDRVKDLILKGLLYEGRRDIPLELLENKYVNMPDVDMNTQNNVGSNFGSVRIVPGHGGMDNNSLNSVSRPNLNKFKAKKSVSDEDIEDRI